MVVLHALYVFIVFNKDAQMELSFPSELSHCDTKFKICWLFIWKKGLYRVFCGKVYFLDWFWWIHNFDFHWFSLSNSYNESRYYYVWTLCVPKISLIHQSQFEKYTLPWDTLHYIYFSKPFLCTLLFVKRFAVLRACARLKYDDDIFVLALFFLFSTVY